MQDLAQRICECFREACLLELRALKPGNVGYHGDGHGMTVQQFVDSAQTAANALLASCRGTGDRILNAVKATYEQVGENTNLGIILLSAPLVEAALQVDDDLSLQRRVQKVLNNLTIDDARACYEAIRLATPGGMGRVDEQDLSSEPDITLLEAMQLAQERDRIAFQYCHQYVDIFDHNLAIYDDFLNKWESPGWAATAVYLSQLIRVPDSLISRKYSVLKAREISDMIAPLAAKVLASQDPTAFESRLLSVDGHLKSIGINPGTTADLTVATLFVAMLESASIRGYSTDESG